MRIQAPNTRFRKAVLGFYVWLGSLIFAAVAPFVAMQLLEAGSLAARVAGVVVGTAGWVPMIFVIVRIIRLGDEFVRRIHLVALALAFASSLVLLTLLDWLSRAHFMAPPDLAVLWLAFALLWAVWLFVVKYRYERQP